MTPANSNTPTYTLEAFADGYLLRDGRQRVACRFHGCREALDLAWATLRRLRDESLSEEERCRAVVREHLHAAVLQGAVS